MKKAPLVSIIIPNRNYRQWLEPCLKSCVRQTYHEIEIIVVDDASEDDSCEFIQKNFGDQVKLIKMDQNKGPAAARNLGMRYVHGEFIQFLDADDFIAPKKIESQMEKMMEGGADLCTCHWKNCYSLAFGDLFGPLNVIDENINLLAQTLRDKAWMPVMSLLLRKNFLERVGQWREDLAWNEDREYRYRMLRLLPKVSFVHETFFFYRDHCNGEKRSNMDYQKEGSSLRLCINQDFIDNYILNDFKAKLFVEAEVLGAAAEFIHNHAENLKIYHDRECREWNDLADEIYSEGLLKNNLKEISDVGILVGIKRILYAAVGVIVRFFMPWKMIEKICNQYRSFDILFLWAAAWYDYTIHQPSEDA